MDNRGALHCDASSDSLIKYVKAAIPNFSGGIAAFRLGVIAEFTHGHSVFFLEKVGGAADACKSGIENYIGDFCA